MSEGEGFLSRWSRRKRMVAAAAPPAAPPAAPVLPEAAAPPPADPKPAFDPASLPPVESLTAESDFAAFLREEVPAALRRAALRRAWALDPAIRDFVGPADYAWDYNAPDGVPGFSLASPSNIERLVAQAVGLGEPRPETSPDAAAAEDADPPLEAPPAAAAEVAAAPADAPAPQPLEGGWEERPVEAPGEPAPAAALPAPAPPAAEFPPARHRRHGGAVPS